MNSPINQIIQGDWIEVAKTLPDQSVHCIITSPPYWGQRNYGVNGQLGLEKTPEEHIEKLVAGFHELRRVLRDDGTLWVNYGDKYASAKSRYSQKKQTINNIARDNVFDGDNKDMYKEGYNDGDLLGLAWRLALALQADGWILRSDIIWAKGLSFCEAYSGSVMPESVNGWRWERCRVKVKSAFSDKWRQSAIDIGRPDDGRHAGNLGLKDSTQWQDCPGCPKCEKNGGLVLRKGSWRPTRGHEYLFQFAKQGGYFCDMEAVREDYNYDGRKDTTLKATDKYGSRNYGQNPNTCHSEGAERWPSSGRNLRDVWVINPQPWGRAHYATFPEKLVEPIIKVATSQKGCCPKCGSPWCRVIDSKQLKRERPNDRTDRHNQGEGVNSCGNTVAGVETTTLGWRATCGCNAGEPVPTIVYDPFMGSGTVAAVAARLGRNYCGSELSKDYIEQQSNIRIAEAETGVSMNEIEQGQKGLF